MTQDLNPSLNKNLTPTDAVDRDSNLVKHAEREMRLIGYEEGDVQWMLRVVSVFTSYGHSGGSAMVFIPQLYELLQFHNLSPLTANPGEWNEIAPSMWQNTRRSDAFSTDGGKTHYFLSDGSSSLDRVKTYTSQERS